MKIILHENAQRPAYHATELLVNNAPNVWAVLKRATPGARQFNGEVIARCDNEVNARMVADALNAVSGGR